MAVFIGSKYKLIEKIGEGSFGQIYKGIHLQTKEHVAIKIEEKGEKKILIHEAHIYMNLKNIKGIPNIRSYGNEGKYTYLAMDILGPSLESIRKEYQKFDLKTVLIISLQLIDRIESLHQHNILHRDIKPDNFLIANKSNDTCIYMIDYGLSKSYKRQNKHIVEKKGKAMIGTARYASLNIHNGIEYSRRDDLEALGYIFIYLLEGKLPWQGLKIANTKEKYAKIKEIKEQNFDILFKTLPPIFIQYVNYCRNLKFTETPNYAYLKNIFIQISQKENIIIDEIYPWSLKESR